MSEKIYYIEFRICEGTIQPTFHGNDFLPDLKEFDWPFFTVLSPDKNVAINEIIAKLESLKDENIYSVVKATAEHSNDQDT